MELTDKVALITGAASGIGLAMAHRFARAGMKVVLADIESETVDAAASAVAEHGTTVEAVVCDVRSDGDMEQAVKTAVALGGLHVMCLNAGVSGGGGPIWEAVDEEWDWVLDVNLRGVLRGIRAGVPVMIEQGEGHIVTTSSMAGITTMPSTGAYTVSKHGAAVMSELLQHELSMAGHTGIGVSVLCPGWVATNLMESDRNRPGGPREDDDTGATDDQLAFREALLTAFHAGKDPSEIADVVHDAVVNRQFWIITHDDWFPCAVGRAEDIINKRNPEVRIWPL